MDGKIARQELLMAGDFFHKTVDLFFLFTQILISDQIAFSNYFQ